MQNAERHREKIPDQIIMPIKGITNKLMSTPYSGMEKKK